MIFIRLIGCVNVLFFALPHCHGKSNSMDEESGELAKRLSSATESCIMLDD